MAQIDATVQINDRTRAWSRTMMAGENDKYLPVQFSDLTSDPNLSRPPDYFLYVFNISWLPHVMSCPPNFPNIQLRACPEDHDWLQVWSVPSTVNEKWVDSASGELRGKGTVAEYFVTNMLNPNNLTGNCWQEVDNSLDAGGMDLTQRGVFWSRGMPFGDDEFEAVIASIPDLTNLLKMHPHLLEDEKRKYAKPLPEEVERAKKRMVAHYQKCIARANECASRNALTEITPEDHAAVDYLVTNRYMRSNPTWHTVIQAPETCPNCGGELKPGASFHLAEFGLCVLPTQEAWKRAIGAGLKKREDVPEELVWWEAGVPPRGPGRPRKEAE